MDESLFDNEKELQESLDEGTVTYRGSGVPSNERLSSALADTQYLTVFRNTKKKETTR